MLTWSIYETREFKPIEVISMSLASHTLVDRAKRKLATLEALAHDL